MQKNAIVKNSQNSKNDHWCTQSPLNIHKALWEVAHGLFKEPITGPLKSKMADIRHFVSLRQNAKTQFSQKLSNLELRCLLTAPYRGFVYSADADTDADFVYSVDCV